ncbi:MAG TPA: hypothetical protein VNY05_15930 [Candidatus Acidoferrales bacterium]|jgi:hypothetical protein|nr:hypothetical protein [Candidatus Acidoferrales bacterium]
MRRTIQFSAVALSLFMGVQAFPSDGVLVVNRGLPQSNLNNASGPVRSNVRWGWHDQGFLGDEFTIGAPGERWVIDAIRTWSVPGGAGHVPDHLADFFEDVRLYFGGPDTGVTPVSTAQLTPGSDETGNGNVSISESTRAGALFYDDFGVRLPIWQVEFGSLNLPVDGGVKYRFGVWGMGRPVPGMEGKTYTWYNHASNAALSGTAQDGADGVMLLFDAGGRYSDVFKADGNGWDKPADINVQVLAHRVPAASTNPRRGLQVR